MACSSSSFTPESFRKHNVLIFVLHAKKTIFKSEIMHTDYSASSASINLKLTQKNLDLKKIEKAQKTYSLQTIQKPRGQVSCRILCES